jgi:hypothetical protein
MTGEDLQCDAAVIIGLWLLIHGGDPLPDEVEVSPATGILAAALVGQLAREFEASERSFGDAELRTRLARIDVDYVGGGAGAGRGGT